MSGVTIDSDRIIEILSQPKPRKEMIYAIRKLRESGLTVASITNNFAIGTTLEQEGILFHPTIYFFPVILSFFILSLLDNITPSP